MKQFVHLFESIDRTSSTRNKVDALTAYFQEAPPEDAAWAVFLLIGRRLKSGVNTRNLREWVSEESGHPPWLVDECYDRVGDLAETLSLLLPPGRDEEAPSLAVIMESIIRPLPERTEDQRKDIIIRLWRRLSPTGCFLFMKFLAGNFRIGVGRTLVSRALARTAGVSEAVMAHRLMNYRDATPQTWDQVIHGASDQQDPGQPYPFYLASPLEDPPETLGPLEDWQAEWKWDGIRAQLIRREGQLLIWSRQEELMTDRFPEITEAMDALPDGTVLDGEILAWQDNRPLPFTRLQRRIGRKNPGTKTLSAHPVRFMAYDCPEADGRDLRAEPLSKRWKHLETLLPSLGNSDVTLMRSTPVHAESWDELTRLRDKSRERGVEGLMLKHRRSPYESGRKKGHWWKWKVDPYTIDAVLVYAQRGHGRRSNLYTDYTFAVWDREELVPIAKAYSGLKDDEFRKVDRFIRTHTQERFGPVRSVTPEQVFELAFEDINESTRHKSGIAVRFPRMKRWRTDKSASEADTLQSVQDLLKGKHTLGVNA